MDGRAGWDIDWVKGTRCGTIGLYVEVPDTRGNWPFNPESPFSLSGPGVGTWLAWAVRAVRVADGVGAWDEVRNLSNLASFNSISFCGESRR